MNKNYNYLEFSMRQTPLNVHAENGWEQHNLSEISQNKKI